MSDNEILLIFLLLSIGFVASTVKASEVDSVFQEAQLMVPVNDMGLEQTGLSVRGPGKYKLTESISSRPLKQLRYESVGATNGTRGLSFLLRRSIFDS